MNDHPAQALIDTGSSDSFICENLVKITVHVLGFVIINLRMNECDYPSTKFSVLKHLCSEVIVGQDLLIQHENLTIRFGGDKPSLAMCGLSTMNIEPPSLFGNLTPDWKPIATKSRRFSK